MKIEHLLDLNILNISEDEVDKAIPKDIDVVNIVDSKKVHKGFFHRPLKIRYVMEVPKDKDSYLASIKRNKRKRILRAFRDCKEQDIEIIKEEVLTEESFKDWFELYKESLGKKKRGIVRINENWVAEKKGLAVGIFARKDKELIGGILLKKIPDKNRMSICYSTIKKEFTKYSVNEYLNFEALMLSSRLGFKTINRGKDTNLYGHHLSPGLFLFKKEFGFGVEPVKMRGDVLTKIVNYDKFEDKIFFFSYGKKGLIGNLILKKEVDSSEFEADFLERLDVYLIKNNKLVKRG